MPCGYSLDMKGENGGQWRGGASMGRGGGVVGMVTGSGRWRTLSGGVSREGKEAASLASNGMVNRRQQRIHSGSRANKQRAFRGSGRLAGILVGRCCVRRHVGTHRHHRQPRLASGGVRFVHFAQTAALRALHARISAAASRTCDKQSGDALRRSRTLLRACCVTRCISTARTHLPLCCALCGGRKKHAVTHLPACIAALRDAAISYLHCTHVRRATRGDAARMARRIASAKNAVKAAAPQARSAVGLRGMACLRAASNTRA